MTELLALIGEDCRTVDAGSRIRDYHLLRALAEVGELSVAAFRQRQGSSLAHRELSCVYYDLGHRRATLSAVMRSCSMRSLYHELSFDWSSHAAMLRPLLEGASVVHGSMLYPVLHVQRMLRHSERRPAVIWDTQNYDPQVWWRRSESGPLRGKIAARTQTGLAIRRTVEAYDAADAILVCSQNDDVSLEALRVSRGLTKKPVLVVENGYDASQWAGVRKGSASGESLLAFGSLNQASTGSGIKWFLREVWPRVSRSRPTATLTIAGRRPDSELIRLAQSPRVRLVSDPPSIPAIAAESAAIVVPQVWGTGTKVKVIEAVASGRPVIASPAAVVGLEALSPYVTLASNVSEWTSSIDGALRSGQGLRGSAAGAEFVERYSWGALGKRYASFVLAVLAERVDAG